MGILRAEIKNQHDIVAHSIDADVAAVVMVLPLHRHGCCGFPPSAAAIAIEVSVGLYL
jgi:hypothetical protein